MDDDGKLINSLANLKNVEPYTDNDRAAISAIKPTQYDKGAAKTLV